MKNKKIKNAFFILTIFSFAVAITLGLSFEKHYIEINKHSEFFEVFKSFNTIEWSQNFTLVLIQKVLIVSGYYFALLFPIIMLLSISVARAFVNKGKNIAWIPISLVIGYYFFVVVITISLKNQSEVSVSYLFASSLMYFLAFCLILVHQSNNHKARSFSSNSSEYSSGEIISSVDYVYTDKDMELDILTGLYDPTSDNYIDPSGM